MDNTYGKHVEKIHMKEYWQQVNFRHQRLYGQYNTVPTRQKYKPTISLFFFFSFHLPMERKLGLFFFFVCQSIFTLIHKYFLKPQESICPSSSTE